MAYLYGGKKMQLLCKFGILQRTLSYSRISQLFISSAYASSGLLAFRGNTLPLNIRNNDTLKLQSVEFSTSAELKGALTSIKNKVSNLMSSSTKAKLGASMAYEKCADTVDYTEFCKLFQLPDTFQSWFLIVQLHVWMCTLVTATMQNSRIFRSFIGDAMWADVEIRLGQFKEVKRSSRKQFLAQIADQFRAAQISYDEGIISDDTVLAAAVWRTIFGFHPIDPRTLEAMVFYIRKQIDHLERQNLEAVLFRGAVEFLPLKTIIGNMNVE